MIKQTILLVILAVLLNQAMGKLSVINQPEHSQFKFNTPIHYSIANFGVIPYGSRSTAKLILAEPEDGCTPYMNEFDPKNKYPFVLIKRSKGVCTFTQKAMVAQAFGAKLAIVYDSEPMDDVDQIVLADDGFGDNVHIPTIFISEEDGEKLIKLLEDDREGHGIEMVIEFSVAKTARVDTKFFINPPEKANFELLNHFFSKYDYISEAEEKGNFVFTPIYDIKTSAGTNYDGSQINCIQNGKYCAVDINGEDAGDGRDLAEEYLYQSCLHQVEGTKMWWHYVRYQHHNCHQLKNMHKCAALATMIDKADKAKVERCMKPNGQGNIAVLDRQLDILKKSNVHYFPSVTINNVKYRGSIYGKDVLEAVCATFEKPSKSCKKLIEKISDEAYHDHDGPNVTIIVLVVVIVLILFFLFMIFVYRRMVTKDLHREMNQEVNQMVSQYISFYESKDQK